MKYIKLYETFKINHKQGDIVLIHYWYNHMITPVILLERKGNKWLVSHNTPKSKIKLAPEELIKSSEIIDKLR